MLKPFGQKLIYLDKVDSTNKYAKELAKDGLEEGTVVRADEQFSGKGRRGRSWISPKGGLYFSIILRPNAAGDRVSLVTLIAGLSVVRALEHEGIEARLKWPNDVILNGKKMSGILCESSFKGNELLYIIAGIGMDTNLRKEDLPEECRERATTILEEKKRKVSNEHLLKAVLFKFEKNYEDFLRGENLIEDIKAVMDTLGREVEVKTSEGTLKGEAVDLDSDGGLLLKLENGDLKKMLEGDCLHIKV